MRKRGFLLAGLLGLLAAPALAEEESLAWKTVQGWEIEARRDLADDTAGCLMGALYDDAVYLAFSAFSGPGGRVGVVTLGKESWRLPDGNLGTVEIHLEMKRGTSTYQGPARGNGNGTGMHVDLEFGQEFFDEVAAAKTIELVTPDQEYRYDLDGTSTAVPELLACFLTADLARDEANAGRIAVSNRKGARDQPFGNDQPFR